MIHSQTWVGAFRLVMLRCHSGLVALLTGMLGISAGTANGQTLYGVTQTAFPNNKLVTINTTTGVGTVVGPLSAIINPNGLAVRAGKLYTFNPNGGALIHKMVELDPATGGNLTNAAIGVFPPFGWNGGGLAFRSDGIGFLGNGTTGKDFYSFDITVGTNNLITGALPLGTGPIAFNSAGILYCVRFTNLYTVDQVTGVQTLVGGTGIVGPNPVVGLSFDAADKLYATSISQVAPFPSSLYTIDTATGTATLIGAVGLDGVQSIAFLGVVPPPVAGATITQSGGTTSVTEGGATDTYTVVLNLAPTADVTITLNPGTQVTATPATLTFTVANWNVAQTVTVTAVDDALVEGAHTGTITHTSASADAAYSAIAIANVVANITDNDGVPPPPAVGALYGITVSTNELITINTTTGAGTLVGPLSSSMNSWGIASRANQLYAWDGTASRLRELNPATGATVNTINIGAIPGPFGEGDLTFRSDGIGFLTAQPGIGQFWRFDPTVPNSTLVGTINPPMDGLAFDAKGILYGLANGGATLHTIDPVTAVTTLVGNTGITGFGLNTSGGLTIDSSGNLFAALSAWPPGPSSLFQINTTTGVGTLVGNIGFVGISGLAFALPPVPPPPPPPPPTPGGGISEGNYSGSKGLSNGNGGEGTFGFGRQARILHPFLKGPYRDPLGTFRVFNVAHEQRPPATNGDSGLGTLGWTLLTLATLAAAAVVYLRPQSQ
ncbi:MAG: hypothetical protein EXS16_10785 [Gemmataceae bacterium]|nr:hypothetical protein [Gemmataceae bacterium]